MIPYGRQNISQDDIKEVSEALTKPLITQGPTIEEFEKQLSLYFGAKFAVAFNSGTSALYCTYRALGLKEDDEFITSPITFTATASAGVLLGAKPVFCDIEIDSGLMDVGALKRAISLRTKMVVPVHYAGHPCNMEEIYKIAKDRGLYIVEDACHAPGAKYNSYKIGSCAHSDAAVFSFHPVKHFTTGEGGAVLTNSEELYEKLIRLRSHGIKRGQDWEYEVLEPSFNFRITDFQCALGLSQLKRLDEFIKERREIATRYAQILTPKVYLPPEREWAYHVYHLYPIRLKDPTKRREVFRKLRSEGFGVQVHYIPVYHHPFMQKIGYQVCKNAEDFYSRVISLPIFPSLTKEIQESVAKKLEESL
ncbi:MAG: UDP-4-amino-4,6-dideoxy-N-acetyl-beta-L-altrosamine transaminase [Aquificaceae bacterium]|nr:UDP-4-amino-4,6-dideoxy-N-acetyl-beta-L-altrosamine transaminase [Aquificaceae bacterium]MDW8237199.1 UDP-4-amino-4,6-dideoxy-N-acetyl-beta-L-altrosamine transaminase [Aquificaceae bacterium]